MTDSTAPLTPPADPRLRTFLPLIYVAWSDGDLTDSEIRDICRAVHATDDLDVDCREGLGRWLDPDRPPDAVELRSLLTAIRGSAAEWSAAEKGELDDQLTASATPLPTAESSAVVKLAEAIGIDLGEALRRVLPTPASPAEERSPTFDVAALQAVLDRPDAETRNRLRTLLADEAFGYRYDLSTEAYRALVTEWCVVLAEHGFGALGLPSEYGGAGDPSAFLAAFETLATHDLSLLVKFGVQFGLFAGSIYQLGTEPHHRRYLAAAGRMELPGCFAMTETGHGSNVAELRTTATFDPATDEWVLDTPDEDARKDYIGNAARDGRMATVFAQLQIGEEGYGVHAFVVPIRDESGAPHPGVTIGDDGVKLGLNGVDNGRLSFAGVRIPRTELLDRFAQVDRDGTYTSPIASPSKRFFTMLGTLVGGRVSVAGAGLSAAKSALTIAIRYAERRRQFGPPGEREVTLLDYTTHQLRLLPRLARSYALHFALRHLGERYLGDPEEARRELEGLAAGLKAISTWHATDTIQECREACGGQGYLAVNRLAALKADTEVFTTFEGDNTVLMQLLTKGLLSEYRKQFGDMNFLDLVRFAAAQAGTAITELNPIVTRNSSATHLRSPDVQQEAFEWREQHLLITLARRLRSRIKGGMDSFTALVDVQDHAVALASAHVERVVFEQFRAAVEDGAAAAFGSVLEPLLALYALDRIESDRGWFQEHGYLEDAKAKAVRREVRRLCREIRPAAVDLVDAFGIPEPLLAAPIAT